MMIRANLGDLISSFEMCTETGPLFRRRSRTATYRLMCTEDGTWHVLSETGFVGSFPTKAEALAEVRRLNSKVAA